MSHTSPRVTALDAYMACEIQIRESSDVPAKAYAGALLSLVACEVVGLDSCKMADFGNWAARLSPNG